MLITIYKLFVRLPRLYVHDILANVTIGFSRQKQQKKKKRGLKAKFLSVNKALILLKDRTSRFYPVYDKNEFGSLYHKSMMQKVVKIPLRLFPHRQQFQMFVVFSNKRLFEKDCRMIETAQIHCQIPHI